MRRLAVAISALPVVLAACANRPELDDFERTLAAQDSATAALSQWCAAKGLARQPTITAMAVAGPALPPPADIAGLLGGEPLAFRHVRLTCGDAVLSEAFNWYVPARLTAQMNRTLDETDTPFGRVAAPLGFRRERIDAMRGATRGCPAGTILTHRARLVLPDGRPLALLVECYTSAILPPASAG